MSIKLEGDPKIFISPDINGIKYENGQPEMDQGLENAIYISLYTEADYWGNILLDDESEKLGSDFEKVTSDIINFDTLRQGEDKAEFALKWFKNDGIAERIEAVLSNPQPDRINSKITVVRPEGGAEEYEINWDRQFGIEDNTLGTVGGKDFSDFAQFSDGGFVQFSDGGYALFRN